MNADPLKTSKRRFRYAQIVPIIPLVVAMGIAAFLYLSHREDYKPKTAGPESLWEPSQVEQNLLRELAKDKNRTLSEEQVVTLKKALAPRKGDHIAMECALGDLQSCCFGTELNVIFENSGWTVEEFLLAVKSTPGKDLILRVKDASVMPKAEFLSRLFRSVGLSVTTQTDSSQMYDLKIIVPSNQAPAA